LQHTMGTLYYICPVFDMQCCSLYRVFHNTRSPSMQCVGVSIAEHPLPQETVAGVPGYPYLVSLLYTAKPRTHSPSMCCVCVMVATRSTHTHSAPSSWRQWRVCLAWWLACCATCAACAPSAGTTAGACCVCMCACVCACVCVCVRVCQICKKHGAHFQSRIFAGRL
jgi:hypothetical protein